MDPAINPMQTKYLEFDAKNVGIRRAKGRFILICNPDDLHTGPLVRFMASDSLEENSFYRTPFFSLDFRGERLSYEHPRATKMFGGPSLKNENTTRELESWLDKWPEKKGAKLLGGWGFQAYDKVCTFDFVPPFNHATVPEEVRKRMFLPAAGDFILASRTAWYGIGGFPELGLDRLDSVALVCLRQRAMNRSF